MLSSIPWLALLAAATQGDQIILGGQGDTCAYTCGINGFKCLSNVPTGNSTDGFTKAGVTCKGTVENGRWSHEWEPAYISDPASPDYGKCVGYTAVPLYEGCNSHHPTAQRLCHCGDDETYRWHFGTGLSAWVLPPQETNVYGHILPPGSTGVITHMWLTCVKFCADSTVIRIYVDGEATPSIDMLPPMAAGVGFNDSSSIWGTKWIGLGAGGTPDRGTAWFNNFRIPFTKSIRVTLHHASGVPIPEFYFIIRGARDMPIQVGGYTLPKTAKLLLQKFEGTLAPLEWLAVTDVPTGSGVHFASTIAVASGDLNFLEGCYHSFSPYGEAFPGVLLSTGTEDYFDSGWYFNAGVFRFPVSGNTHLDTKGGVTWSAYRLHDQDPLFFEDGLKVLWRNGDVLDPTTKTKCYTQQGEVVGHPTNSTVVSYAWVYVW